MRNSQYRWQNIYTPKFGRALASYCINGFFERELDADDHEFLEHVRERGIANGDLPNTNYFVLEELDYWHMPYGIDHSVNRRHGEPKKPKAVIIPDAEEARNKAKWNENRKLLAQARAEALAEWKKKQLEREERRKAWEQMDLEWEAHAPPRPGGYEDSWKSEKLPSRHYVPFWKRREIMFRHMTKKRREKFLEQEARERQRLEYLERERLAQAKVRAAKARTRDAIDRYLHDHIDEITAILEAPLEHIPDDDESVE